MEIREITDKTEKQQITRMILEALSDWFGIPEAREEYISESRDLPMIAAYDEDRPAGFICLKKTGKDTAELHVMGVLPEYHRQGIGTQMFAKAKEMAVRCGYTFLQVKTVQMGRYPEYDQTNSFYRSLGFKEFEVFPAFWDERNPCQIYIMYLG